MAKLSVELNRFFFEEERHPEIKLADILMLAGERLFGFLFVLLALPSALPVPAPGYSIPFGIVIFLLAGQLLFGRKIPWLPQRVLHYSLKLKQIQKIVKAGLPWLRRIEAISRPRYTYICNSIAGQMIIGGAIALMAISMMIPIPGTNTLPAVGVFVTGFGLLDDDGIISLTGLVLCLVGGLVSASILFAVIWGGSSLIDLAKEWISNQ